MLQNYFTESFQSISSTFSGALKSIGFSFFGGGSVFFAPTTLHPGESKIFTHVLHREYSKRKISMQFHVIFHPGMQFINPPRRNHPFNNQMSQAEVKKMIEMESKEFMQDLARAEKAQSIAWKTSPLNQDFVSNEISF